MDLYGAIGYMVIDEGVRCAVNHEVNQIYCRLKNDWRPKIASASVCYTIL
ncbi:hypothetical protein KS4_35590 [Poriferisphaera corsica]|uniref:Uncharacterized protein n=1 Tax=Poriferisphaera corsica TaxID=2528020 RepID=A0A517YZ29_9BACT|nr:hypothetical protein KS4_35590 [Poriferisphaera corsica]